MSQGGASESGPGLSEDEAARRHAAQPPVRRPASSRSYLAIVRANVLTVFNLILLVFGGVTLAVGFWQDALFLVILVANAGIGITQEVRSKRALDRLAALVSPTARVVRDGRERALPVGDLVTGDLVRLGPGDQVVADGRLVGGQGAGFDESLLSGEAVSTWRTPPDGVRSGSFCIDGGGDYLVEASGDRSYAQQVAGEARRFRRHGSPLERSINNLLFVMVAVMVPLAVVFGWALARQEISLRQATSESAAAVVPLVPEGLILLAGLTYAVGGLRLARAGALAQQLSAIEALASVEILCLDKTGTLTSPELPLVGWQPAPGIDRADLAASLARYAASSSSPNPTLSAIGGAGPAAPAPVEAEVAFASGRRWGALRIDGTTYVLGAAERFELGPMAAAVDDATRSGRRVLPSPPRPSRSRPTLPLFRAACGSWVAWRWLNRSVRTPARPWPTSASRG